jgi:hypothetical protein
MKKILFVLLVSVFVFSCSSDNDEPTIPTDNETIVLEGKQIFRIDLKELTAKSLSVGNQKNLEPAFVLLSINDDNGNSILTREKIALIKDGDSYKTSEITLESGTYAVTEFIVTDSNDVVISIAPKEGSVLAQFSTKPLPFNFVVSPDEIKETATENINAAGYTSVDFGYTELSLIFPENTDFFSLTVDESALLTTKTIALKSITGSSYVVDWGDGVVEEYISTKTEVVEVNDLTHLYEQQESYTITISGPIEAIEYFSFIGEIPNEIYKYQSNLSAIDLSKLTLLKDLSIYTGNLTDIDISKNTTLVNLGVRQNRLTSIDLTNNPNLKEIFIDDNEISSINVAPHLDLERLHVNGNQLSDLDISNNGRLLVLDARENSLNAIDLTNNPELTFLTVNFNNITTLDITQNKKLLDLSARENQINGIDLSKNSELRSIDLYQNQITNINVSSNLNLNRLNINDNQLTSLNLSNNPKLESLSVKNNMLSELDLASNQKINAVHILGNQFSATELDEIITQTYNHAIQNETMGGFIDYQNNPGFADIAPTSIDKLNELVESLNWTIIDY